MTSAFPEILSRLRRIRHIALDMDGTINRGKTLFPFTNGFLARMAEDGAEGDHGARARIEAF